MVIYKYPLSPFRVNCLPNGKLLDIQVQDNVITAWVLLSHDFPPVTLQAFPTGESEINVTSHAKTIQHGLLVWHFFYV